MDNQANTVMKQYLTNKGCANMLVEPHNHRVNAAERAIQTFKAHFISALATTDSDFPLQLWDCLTPQVVATLNMLRPARINTAMSTYEAIYSPYDWNWYPLAPPGCKAVIYEAPEVRGSWASHGTDAWCVSLSLDHYHCNHYFLSRRLGHTEYQDLRNYSHSTVRSHFYYGTKTYKKLPMNSALRLMSWNLTDELNS
jgi:hypothetical protein